MQGPIQTGSFLHFKHRSFSNVEQEKKTTN